MGDTIDDELDRTVRCKGSSESSEWYVIPEVGPASWVWASAFSCHYAIAPTSTIGSPDWDMRIGTDKSAWSYELWGL